MVRTPTISFNKEPVDDKVCVGDTAHFDCDINNWPQPEWYINEEFYQSYNLPLNHKYIRKQLTISNVTIHLNGTRYKCSFVVLNQGRKYQFNSTCAILQVYSKGEDVFLLHVLSCKDLKILFRYSLWWCQESKKWHVNVSIAASLYWYDICIVFLNIVIEYLCL